MVLHRSMMDLISFKPLALSELRKALFSYCFGIFVYIAFTIIVISSDILGIVFPDAGRMGRLIYKRREVILIAMLTWDKKKLAHRNLAYQVLGLTSDSSQEELRKRYKQLILSYHPDKNPQGATKFQQIQNAYKTILNPTTFLDNLESILSK